MAFNLSWEKREWSQMDLLPEPLTSLKPIEASQECRTLKEEDVKKRWMIMALTQQETGESGTGPLFT